MPIKVQELLSRYALDPREATWTVQGKTTVIKHWALERIAAQSRISFPKVEVVLARPDAAALIVHAERRGEDMALVGETWSIGEAAIGTNYQVSGKQAGYPWAMAEKRGKDRCILKLLEIEDAVDEAEAEEQGYHPNSRERQGPETRVTTGRPPRDLAEVERRQTPSQRLKTKMFAELVEVEPDEIDRWLRSPRVVNALGQLAEIDRLDVERTAREKRDGHV